MSGIIDATNWISEHMEDRSSKSECPPKPTHPVEPDYVIKAAKNEAEAWNAYQKISDQEFADDKVGTDYKRVNRARRRWLVASDELTKAHNRWAKEQK